MALKDWKKAEENIWEHRIKDLQIVIERTVARGRKGWDILKTTKDFKNLGFAISFESSFKKALKQAKQYMRKH